MYGEDCTSELEQRMAQLAQSRLELDDRITLELLKRNPDQKLVNDLKRQILGIKGEMAAMGGAPATFTDLPLPFPNPRMAPNGQEHDGHEN